MSIEVTLSGIVMEVRPLQSLNALAPIEVTGKPFTSDAISISFFKSSVRPLTA